jgi:outer membrane protein
MKAYRRSTIIAGLLLVALSGPLTITAQQTLTLHDCVQIGLSNNISIKKVNNNFLIAQANEKQSKLEYLPRVSATGSYNITHGLSNDPTTFEPVTATTKSSTPSLAMDLNIFNGMKTRNFARRNTLVREAADLDLAQTRDDI